MQAKDVVRVIGSNDLTSPKTRVKLANFIYKKLELNHKKVRTLETWEVSAQ
jgi:hypothetical protein